MAKDDNIKILASVQKLHHHIPPETIFIIVTRMMIMEILMTIKATMTDMIMIMAILMTLMITMTKMMMMMIRE